MAFAEEVRTVTFQNGMDGYEGAFDRRIGPGGETDGVLIGGQTTYYLDGGGTTLNDSSYTQGLIRFSGIETAIPAGATIVEAKLTVVTKTHGNAQSGDSFNVYRLTREFNSESSVTTDFGSDGIQGDADWILGSFHGPNIGGEASVVSADVTRAVQSWVDGSPNHGLGIRSDMGINGWSFHTTGAAANLRPKLEVTYVTEGASAHEFQQGSNNYAGGIDIFLNGRSATSEIPGETIIGATVQEAWLDGLNPGTTEPDIPAMLVFAGAETAIAGRKIESATLRLVTGFSSTAADSPGPFTIHRLLVPFSETSGYGDFAGDAGAMLSAGQITPAIAVCTSIADTEVIDVDVSEAARAWAAGEPNYGFYISSGTPNGWQIFTSGATDPSFRPLLRVVSTPALPVSVISPVASSRHVQGTDVTFRAGTSVVPPTGVSQVQFFVDDVLVGTDSSAPFTFSYQAGELGNFVLTAVLTDSNSQVIVSEPVPFSVVPSAGVGGLYFDGMADQVALGDPDELKLSTFTLETWFRRESPGTSTTTGTGGVVAIPLIAKGRNQADNSSLDTNWFLGLREADGVLCGDFEGASGTNVPVAGTTPVPYGIWQHAAATFDGTEWRLYLNGNLEAVRNSNGLTPRADSIQHASIATAMNSNGLGEGAFGGFLDEVRIWSVARSHGEIRQTIHAELASASGLVARWGMSEGSGNTLTSTAASSTIGSFGGAPVWTAGMVFSNNIKPSIRFISPSDGSHLLNNETLPLAVTASDPDGSVAKVEYFDRGVLIGSSTSAPFGFTYQNPPVGARRLTAVATDNGGESSRTDTVLTVNVTFGSPVVPGYSAAIIDGADQELFGGVPAADPAPWSIVSSSATPRQFNNLGAVSGDISVNINGNPLPYHNGVLLATNAVVNENFAAIDNLVAPYESGGIYRVSSMDNSGPGELEPTLSPESSSFSLGWFPYSDGWIGAKIAADGLVTDSNSLPVSVTVTNPATGTYRVAGLPTSGNLLALAVGQGTDNYAAVAQSGEDWIVTVRDNNQNLENGEFAFLYVPTTAQRVLSGKIGNLGEFTALNEELTLMPVSCHLTAQGYEITFGNGTLINPSNTALFITSDPDAGNGGDNAYSYSSNGNSFVVFSHDLPGLNGILQNGGFRFLATPLDPIAPSANEVVLTATQPHAAEGGANNRLVFTVTRRGPIENDLPVSYTVGGNATPGSDFTGLSGTVIIPAGSSSAAIHVDVLADSVLEPRESVSLALAAGAGYSVGLQSNDIGWIDDAGPALPTTTLVFQQGVEGYTGQFQKRVGYALSSGTYTAQLGSAVATYAVDGGDPDINDLIRFDGIIGGPGGIPAEATILKAELILTTAIASDAQTSGPFIIDRLTSPVNEATTYDSLTGGIGFEGVRGISTGLPVAGFPALAQGEAGAADVTGIVRAWVAGESNHGFGLFSGGTGDGWNYATVGNPDPSLRPKLVVTYLNQPTKEYIVFADRSARISSAPGAATIDGATLEVATLRRATNDTQEALLHFPVSFGGQGTGAIPLDEEIVKAELLVTTPGAFFGTGSHTAGQVSIHQVLEEWNTSSQFGLHGPKIGDEVDDRSGVLTGLGQGSTTWVDVTSMVRNWRAGDPNHGFNLKPGSGDDWMLFWPGTAYGPEASPRLRITTVNALNGGGNSFNGWSESFGLGRIAQHSDDDRDGISALVEYALGLNPTSSDVLPALIRSGNNVSLTFRKGIQAAADPRVSYRIMSSPNLRDWSVETPSIHDSQTISLTEARGPGSKFFRLEIIYAP